MSAPRFQRFVGFVLAALTVIGGRWSSAQEGIDLRGRLDASPGGTLLGNRPGPSIGRTPRSAYIREDVLPPVQPDRLGPAPTTPDFLVENAPKEAPQRDMLGQPGWMTLEQAIDRLVHCNLDIIAARSEVDQARSDIITAGLRNNPQFFTDMQQVPYRVLAPGQADVNFAYPVDVSGKSKTRVKSAVCVLRSVEWKYQNFVRTQIDNLYTVFIDALVAQETVWQYDPGNPKHAELGDRGVRLDPTQESAKAEAESTGRDARRKLALLLNIPNPDAIKLRGVVYDSRPADDQIAANDARMNLAHLKQLASLNRPDLLSQRWTLYRAFADVEAVRASRFDDVTFLVQPYTYSPMFPNRTAWALGITVPLPIYNRQQGNLAKAEQIVAQTRAVLSSLENSVAAEVDAAYNALNDSLDDMKRFAKQKVLGYPLNLADLDPKELPQGKAFEEYIKSVNPILIKAVDQDREQKDRNYYNAIILHRKSVLRINTACAFPVWDIDPEFLNDPASSQALRPRQVVSAPISR